MTKFIILKAEYCGNILPTKFKGVIYERKEYEFFFVFNVDGQILITLDHIGHGEKTYLNIEEFFKEWRNVTMLL